MVSRIVLFCVLLTGTQFTLAQSFADRLSNAIGIESASDEILDPEVAFTFETKTTDPYSIQMQWHVEDGYYLYRDKFQFSLASDSATLDKSQLLIPNGKSKEDPAFGQVEINTGEFSIDIPIERTNTDQVDVNLEVRYQGCKEDSVCYPPIVKHLPFSLPSFIASASAAEIDGGKLPGTPMSEQDTITQQLREGGFIFNLLAFFGFGLLLSLTPCVFPMIPILSGIIVGQSEDITSTKAFSLSIAYVLAMALTYAVLGVVAGSFSFNIQAAFQNPWLITAFSGVFVVLALSMFGFYELQLPAAIQTRLSAASDSQKQGSLRGAAVMGALSAIIVGPCVAPPLAGALLYISQTGNALFGGLALFAMGLGFGVPLLVIGSSAGTLLPRAGSWMESVKRFFGVMMLAVAIWFLERILPADMSMLLWSSLFIISAVCFGAMDKTDQGTGWSRFWKGIGVAVLVYGIILLIGAASGGKSLRKPLEGLSIGASSQQESHRSTEFKRIKSLADLRQEIEIASTQDKMVMLDFYADWCISCKEMEEYTFSNGVVSELMQDLTLLQVDVTANDDLDRELLNHFELFGPPAILFFGADGLERPAFRLVGFVDADRFAEHIKKASRS